MNRILFASLLILSGHAHARHLSASVDTGAGRLRNLRMVFLLGADCPVSQQYMPVILEVARSWKAKGLKKCSIVFCNGPARGRRRIARSFMKEYGFDMPWRTDPGNRYAHRVGASVLPQVLVFQKGEKVYSGAIDNMFAGLGQRRAFTTEHYLIDALEACRNGQMPSPASRPAYGCLVE